jgi:heme-degrading monooxygenase HmoA
MIRVLYKFTLRPGCAERFASAWRDGTLYIREHVPGAHGSVLLRSHGKPDALIALAHWDSIESWRARSLPASIADSMKACLAADTAYEVFEDVADLTIA